MDTKIEIKEEDHLSEERQLLTKNVKMETNSDSVFLDNDCDMAIKTEIKSETAFPELCMQNERKFVPDYVMNNDYEYISDYEMDNETETKEQPWRLEREASSVCDDLKEQDFTPVTPPRFTTMRCSNGCKMDSKIEIKEEVRLSDNLVPQTETDFFTNNATMKAHSDTALLNEDCNMTIKTEIKSETAFPGFSGQKGRNGVTKHYTEQLRSKTVTSNIHKIDVTD